MKIVYYSVPLEKIYNLYINMNITIQQTNRNVQISQYNIQCSLSDLLNLHLNMPAPEMS